MPHLFNLGQTVFLSNGLSSAASGEYSVVRLLPPNEAGEPLYRLKSKREVHERLASEFQLRGEPHKTR